MHFQLWPTVLLQASLAKHLGDGIELTASSGHAEQEGLTEGMWPSTG